jgi:hypothetical protein
MRCVLHLSMALFLLGPAACAARGAEPVWWSFRKPERSIVPATKDPGRPENPIDAFILAKLEEKGLPHAPLADRRTLIRRAYFDLIGLPPAPDRVERFVNDSSPKAFANLIDELLTSRQYGERWGRHWLDVARYADTGGYETDIYFKNAWRYRDYVVKSFNDDKPYNRFVQEQVAGDEIWPDNLDLDGSFQVPPEKLRHLEARVGTGLYALGPQVHESNMEAKKAAYDRLTDCVDTTGSAFLGITIGCARCHDHKFDPFTQLDYYGLQAVFAGSKEVEIPVITAMEIADHKQHYPRLLAVDEARRALRLFEKSVAGRKPTAADEKTRQQWRQAVADAVLGLPEQATSAPNDAWDGLMEIPTATVLGHETPELVLPVYRLRRGDIQRPKEKMQPALPVVLARQTGHDTSLPGPFGSRKALALWLTQPDSPLTARVMVNRIWAWHFGRGIVSTANDFGKMGALPTHPELLDWLATEFVARNWSIKEMHRLIMLSNTYQMSTAYNARAAEIDPENTMLWRVSRRRLEAEEIRDAIMAVSGNLDLTAGGTILTYKEREYVSDTEKRGGGDYDRNRRAVYIPVVRSSMYEVFQAFDLPDPSTSNGDRNTTVVAPQALFMMNGSVVLAHTRAMAEKLLARGDLDDAGRIRDAYERALGRPPSAKQIDRALTFIAQVDQSMEGRNADPAKRHIIAWQSFCKSLLASNEFIYLN